MCGITGIYEWDRSEGSVSEEVVCRMRDTLVHRGPDGEGMHVTPDRRVGLGHRRLAIVDVAGGIQPMFGPGGTSLVFNGEIYNYPYLRRELEADGVAFETNCDTEVILHLYERHGADCVDYLNGMFAFALWDPARERLFFARDRVGEKPFYWADVDGRFIFGSEIKALLEHPSVTPAVNEGAIVPYLTNMVSSSPETLYRGIYKLPLGSKGICDPSGVRVFPYWNLFEPREWSETPLPESSSAVREMLEQSVHDRLMSDVPVGVLLSGGIDSTTLVALLRDRARGLATFSVGFTDYPDEDERDIARRVARHYKTDHHEVTVSGQEALEFLPRLVHHQDEPLADPVCLPLHFVCELARRNGVKVVLGGEGADEVFWGYEAYRRILVRERWVRTIMALPGPARAAVPKLVSPKLHARLRELLDGIASRRPQPMHMPTGVPYYHRKLFLEDSFDPSQEGWSPTVDPVNGEDPLSVLGFDTQEYEFGLRLPELLLMRIDRFSMANSVEARVPFLEPGLVEYAYRLPMEQKMRDGLGKIVLREAISDTVPDWVLNRPKMGFGPPILGWLGSDLHPLFSSMLGSEAMRFFDTGALEKALRRSPGHSLWPILNFGLWHRQWIEGEPLDSAVGAFAAASA